MHQSFQKDEKPNEIIKELEKIIEKTGYHWFKSNKKSISNKYAFIFNECKIIAYLVFTFIILCLFLILFLYLVYSDISSWKDYLALILTMIIFFRIGLGAIDSTFSIFKRKTPKEFINKLKETTTHDYWYAIEKLGNNIDLVLLKKEKIKIKIILNKRKKTERIREKFNYIFTLLLILLTIYVFSIPVDSLDKNQIVSLLGLSGLISMITATLSLIMEVSDGDIIVYEKCLFVLQEAEILANALEEKKFRNIMLENKVRASSNFINELEN